MAALDGEAIDDVLYLARVNEPAELESYLAQLAAHTQRSVAEVVAAAVDPDSKNGPLHYAAANGHTDVIRLLVAPSTAKPAPSLINAVNEAGNTPLHWAALNGHLESVKLLLHAGASVGLFNRAGHDAVFEAEINDKQDVVDWLLGAVDELESGIDPAGTAAATRDRGDGMNGGDEDTSSGNNALPHSSSTTSTAAAASEEHVTKHMADLTTTDEASPGG